MQGVGADPVPGESLPGFVMRVADGLKFDSAERLAGMCRLRQPGSAVTSDALIDLSVRSGASVAALEAISYRPSPRFAHNAFLGGSVHREFIDIGRRRLCPRCIEESPHHRACWDLTLMTACPDHGIRLIDRCPRSGRRCGPDWKQPDVRRCRCGTDLTSLAGSVVSPDEAQAGRRLIALVSGEELPWLPASLGRCERPDLLRLVMTIGMFLTGWTRERRIKSLVNTGTDAVSSVVLAGLHWLEEWPQPLYGFLETERRATAGRPGRYGARKALGAFYSWLTLMEDGETKSVLAAAARDFVEGDPQLARKVHRSRLLTRPERPGPLVGLNEAAEMLAVSGERVKRLMKSGVLPEVQSEGRGVPMMLERAAVSQLAVRNAASLNLEQTAASLGISKSRVRRLVDGGILIAAHSAFAENQAAWSFDSGDVASFLKSLSDLSRADTDGAVPVGFEYAVEVLRRRGTDIVSFIRLVLDLRLPVTGLNGGATGLKRLMFDRLTNRPQPAWLAGLAEATGTPLSGLEAISYGPLDPARCRFNGVTLPASVLKARGGAQRKVCPECMTEHRYHRGIWDLLFISACAVHSRELVDACYSCGNALRWRGLSLDSCDCRNGGDFTSYVAVPVDRDLMRATRMIYGLLGDVRFTGDAAEIRGLPPFTDIPDNEIIEFLFRGGLEMMGARLKVFSMEHPGDHAWNAHLALAHGLAAAENWPQGFFEILDTMRRRSADTHAVSMRKNVVPVERWLARMGPKRGLVIRAAVDEYRARPYLAKH